jgi:hypothetical protein
VNTLGVKTPVFGDYQSNGQCGLSSFQLFAEGMQSIVMLFRIFALLTTMFGAGPTMAVTLAHPQVPILEACAVDMNVGPEVIADRIRVVGWIETSLTPDMDKLGQDYSVLDNFGTSVFFGEDSIEDWTARLVEVSDFLNRYQYENMQDRVRAFADPQQSGFAVLISDQDGFWTCEVLLTKVAFNASEFMSDPPTEDDSYSTDGIRYMSDQDRRNEFVEFLGLLPFMPTPRRYYSNYILTDPEIIEYRYGYGVDLSFAATFSTEFPF